MGHGIRLDSNDLFQGAVISPFYDPLLVKCTSKGHTLEAACRKALRALREFRVRGVETNVSFLIQILCTPTFLNGDCWTTFIDDCPELLVPDSSQNRAQKFLRFLADAAVNGSRITGQVVCHAHSSNLLQGILKKGFEETSSIEGGHYYGRPARAEDREKGRHRQAVL
jgi:pyruvate carboxylase